MSEQSTYHLGVGEQGKARRVLLNDIINPVSQNFIKSQGLKPGANVLELGCGMGFMANWLAEEVAPDGTVTAIDNSPEQLTIAEEITAEQGNDNISFQCLDVADLHRLEGQFDFVYSRFLLIHLQDPEKLVQQVFDLLAPGGIFACESAIIGHEFCYPENSAFNVWRRLNFDVLKAMDKDPQTGKKLARMMSNVGFANLQSALHQGSLDSGTQRQEMLVNDLEEQENAFIQAGLIGERELVTLKEDLQEIVEDESYFVAYCQSCQIAGTKNML